ncbi:MAG: hypothetical protein K2Y23_01900 [Cyanobacteria bacterium]|nr:hypothetical protein [Cyanobacteriota bacterium]
MIRFGSFQIDPRTWELSKDSEPVDLSPRLSLRRRAATIKDPFQDWVKGRLALDTLDASKLNDAVQALERTALELPKYAPAHAGLANGYLLQYERTRFGSTPDRSLIARAIDAARQATTVDPSLGEGWAVLGYLLFAAGKVEEGQAAARRATALEPVCATMRGARVLRPSSRI